MGTCALFLLLGVLAHLAYSTPYYGYDKSHGHHSHYKYKYYGPHYHYWHVLGNHYLKKEINHWNKRAEFAFVLGTDKLLKLLTPDMVISRPFLNPFGGKKGLPENFNRIKRLGGKRAKFTIYEVGKVGLKDLVFQRGKIEYFDKKNRLINFKSTSGNLIMIFKRINGKLFPTSACVSQLN